MTRVYAHFGAWLSNIKHLLHTTLGVRVQLLIRAKRLLSILLLIESIDGTYCERLNHFELKGGGGVFGG